MIRKQKLGQLPTGVYSGKFHRQLFNQNSVIFRKPQNCITTLNDTEGEINVLTDVGYILTLVGQLQQGYEAFLKALQLVEGINYPYTHYNTDAITMVTAFQGKFGEPLKYALQTIKIAETTRDSLGWGYFYARLGMLYYSEGREKESYAMV